MRRFKDKLWVIPIVLIAWLPFFMGAWDKTLPADASAWNDAAGYIRANNTVLESAIGAEHDFNASTQTGVHTSVTVSGTMAVTGVTTVGGINQQVVVVPDNAAYDVLAANTGKIHVIPGQTANITMDLPTEAAGLFYRFVYVGGAEDAQNWIIDSEANANFFIGGLMTHDDDDNSTLPVYSDGADDSICTILTPGAGTEVEIWSDGTHWYITGTVVSGTDTSVVFSNL